MRSVNTRCATSARNNLKPHCVSQIPGSRTACTMRLKTLPIRTRYNGCEISTREPLSARDPIAAPAPALNTARAMLLGSAENLDRVDGQHGHPPEAPGLADEAVQPLHSGPTHPRRRPRHAPGQVVERAAHAHRDCHGKPVPQPVDPKLLGRGAVRDEKRVGAVLPDQPERLSVVRGIRAAGVRGDGKSWVGGAQTGGELVRDSRPGAEQEEAEAAARAHRRDRLDQVDARNRAAKHAALAPGGPDDAGAIGQAKLCGGEHPGKLGVVLRPHHELWVHRCDEVEAAFVNEVLEPLERFVHVQAVDPYPKNSGLVQDGSTSRVEIVVDAMLGPRLVMNSCSDSPPPTRTRPHAKRSARLCTVDEIEVVTAVL